MSKRQKQILSNSSRNNKQQLNWLRAAVLGANDGIVSVAGIVVGVASATNNKGIIFTAGLAGLVAGSLSMSTGEYVSVSTQRDSEKVSGVESQQLTNPWHAAFASAAAFIFGAIIPLAVILLPSQSNRIWITFVSVILALSLTGYLSARAGGAKAKRAIIRVVLGGVLAMSATYFIGQLFNVTV